MLNNVEWHFYITRCEEVQCAIVTFIGAFDKQLLWHKHSVSLSEGGLHYVNSIDGLCMHLT